MAGHDTLRDHLASGARALLRGFRSSPAPAKGSGEQNSFWALKDVSFDVEEGTVLGVVGRNGAGKSTLLKILSQITEPTSGEIRVRGRVASLLEVGTGFHPELSGRENVFLNGAILGMSRAEIRSKFDEIVTFAGVEKFLDTPVKRYSSGMYVRLAFSVAAHLEPEILVVDEVLAVGDASFQRRCLDKMEEAGQGGRTVLFVSHNMSAVTRLCQRAILLQEGRVIMDGLPSQVVSAYLTSGFGTTAENRWPDPDRAPGNDIVRLRAIRVRDEQGHVKEALDIRTPVGIDIEYEVLKEGHVLVPNVHLTNEEGVYVFAANETDPEWRGRKRPPGRFVTTAWIPGNLLAEGMHFITVAISTLDPVIVHFVERNAIAFQVVDTRDGDSARGDYAGPFPGAVRPMLRWSTRECASREAPGPLQPTAS